MRAINYDSHFLKRDLSFRLNFFSTTKLSQQSRGCFVSIKLAAAKVIFYGFMSLQSHENVEFVTNSPKRHETVIDTERLHIPTNSSYYNVLKNGHGYDFVFRNRTHDLGGSTCLYNTRTKRLVNVIENGYFLNHNFCLIASRDGNGYYGMGGMHSKHLIELYRTLRQKTDEEPMICHANTEIVSPDIFSKYHHNGLYLLHSPDKVHWNYVKDLPVISGIHPGHTDRFFGYTTFDSKIVCFYSELLGQYMLFSRANVGRGKRWIQTTRSKDLIHWEPFQLLQMEGVDFDNDNYYHFDVMEYPGTNLFVGLSPYTNRPIHATETCIKLMFSTDGIHWTDSGSILKTPLSRDGYRNSTHTTSVFFDRGSYYDMFFNENYDGVLDTTKSATVVNYRVPKDRLVGARPKLNDTARLTFAMNIRSDNIIVNFNCQDSGYIKLRLNDDVNEHILCGNHLNKKIAIDSTYIGRDMLVHVEMKDCILYSCTS